MAFLRGLIIKNYNALMNPNMSLSHLKKKQHDDIILGTLLCVHLVVHGK